MKAVICGAGIAGLALAGRLHNVLGWEVVVLEKAPQPRAEGCMVDFSGPGYDAAEAMGVLPWLEELSYPVSEAAFLDEDGRCRARLDYDRLARSVNGRLLSIMRPDLELALREGLSLAVGLRFGVGPARIDPSTYGVRVTLTDGSVLDADLLVGADGLHSTVRAMVFGEEQRYVRYLGYHTAAFTFDDPYVHAELGNRFCLTDTAERQMGLYALRDGTVAAFAVHRSADPRRPDDARAALYHEYGTLGWLVPRVLAACPPPPRVYYDQVAQTDLPSWSRGRVVLVGDACQAVSLVAGQGASLAIAGAYVLVDQLAGARRVEDALHGYERIWRPVITDRQRAARRTARWFVPEFRRHLRVRRAALRFVGLPGLSCLAGTSLTGKQRPLLRQLAAVPA
ncbi:FAD-dependent monooxygenase [Streptomyces sp. SLBN-31]|uniref:FAD-dependent monooxygenase n=1 Tax=Streptomyces sp. SLBN-31 TaxID=2768444 RepID=UPI00115173B5|nr:FAD-dependent monooxygenase [Streptomyces sp. SLBN-31]TQJ91239.1 2-polyprenyl-6-methoxyphenol hydroxylase-like FAD-dependent oxidoreductase [Streptomyces sp. SLBN-31]